ncbi:hypothetical protein [Mailhella massiliensis]|uniref:hypothetical protein n=1 Tax=Mailhella massiliensis TaxID=1903261 RepID=UPI0023567792|nr:hypothetical protein [Mailhella massiliensis]
MEKLLEWSVFAGRENSLLRKGTGHVSYAAAGISGMRRKYRTDPDYAVFTTSFPGVPRMRLLLCQFFVFCQGGGRFFRQGIRRKGEKYFLP